MKIEKPTDVAVPSHATRFEQVSTAAGEIVLCNPTRVHYRQWRSLGMKADGDIGQAYETLFLATCVKPNGEDLKKMLDEWPGIVTDGNVISAMNRLAGITSDDASKT